MGLSTGCVSCRLFRSFSRHLPHPRTTWCLSVPPRSGLCATTQWALCHHVEGFVFFQPMVMALFPHHVGMVPEAAGYGAACLRRATRGSLRALRVAASVYLHSLPGPFDVGCCGSLRNAGEVHSDSSRREVGQVLGKGWGGGRQGGVLAQGLGIRLFAFGGAYWPLTTAHSDPLWAERVLVVSTEPLDDLSCLTTPEPAVLETGCCPCC